MPVDKGQENTSRVAVESVLQALLALKSAIEELEHQAARTDTPTHKANVAKRVRSEAEMLQKVWKKRKVRVYDHARWMKKFKDMADDLAWSAAQALEHGINPGHGRSKTIFPYQMFVRRLYKVWCLKRSDRGVYMSGGLYQGKFVDLLEACEELLLPAALKPPSSKARGERIARAIGLVKSPNRS